MKLLESMVTKCGCRCVQQYQAEQQFAMLARALATAMGPPARFAMGPASWSPAMSTTVVLAAKFVLLLPQTLSQPAPLAHAQRLA